MPGKHPHAAPTPRPLRGLAAQADRYDLYQRAVQNFESEADFVHDTFRALRHRPARIIREDFCGTFGVCCEWARRHRKNVAAGLDIDPEPVEWGRLHNLSRLTPAQQARVHPVMGNVLHPPRLAHIAPSGFDAVLAMNFSYWCFKQRATMLRYYRRVRTSLARDGVFFLDACGGADCLRICKENRPIGRRNSRRFFTYVWDHAAHDPITGDITCKIHFRFPDGSSIRDAFTYQWRYWTLPDITDMLREAGFRRATVYWEGDDGKGGGNGEFKPAAHGDCCDSYICYIVAEK